MYLLLLHAALAAPVLPRASHLEVTEALSIVREETLLVSVELTLRRERMGRRRWRDTVTSATFDLVKGGREIRYDSEEDPAAIGATWVVSRKRDGALSLSEMSVDVSWLDATLIKNLARRMDMLPVRLTRKDPPLPPLSPQAHCDAPCSTAWKVETRRGRRARLSMAPLGTEVSGTGVLLVDRSETSLSYAVRRGGARPMLVLGEVVLRAIDE